MVFQNSQDTTETNYSRLFKSPHFSFSNSGTILTSAFKLFDYHQDTTRTQKYGSYNNIFITNSSSYDILVYPNQDKTNGGIIVKAGTSQTFDDKIIPSTTSLLIENIGAGSITANQIRLTIWKDRTEFQNIVSNVHEKFFSSERNTLIDDISAFRLKFKRKI